MQDQEQLAGLVASGRATAEDMDLLGRERVLAIKANPEVPQMRARASEPISINEDARTISYLVSDETPDRMGDIIRVKGWDVASYKQNPVVLWAHDGKSVPPIGKATNVRRRYGPARLTADIEFAPKEAHEFADTIYQLASRGFVRATSVGFMPRETEEVDEKKREKLGLGPYGQLYTGAELMEISVVAVPANPSALQDGVKTLAAEGLLDSDMVARFFDSYPPTVEDATRRIRAACRSFVDFGAAQHLADSIAEPSDQFSIRDADVDDKSPACRADDETADGCVARKVPEMIDEGMEHDQAVAAANSICETRCDDTKDEARLVDAVASLIEQQAEQTRATRQLVDALSDLTTRLHVPASGGVRGGPDRGPDAAAPDAAEPYDADMADMIESASRGFAERVRRDLSNNTRTRGTESHG